MRTCQRGERGHVEFGIPERVREHSGILVEIAGCTTQPQHAIATQAWSMTMLFE